MKAFFGSVAVVLLVFVFHSSPLYPQDFEKLDFHITGGMRRGSFDELNDKTGLSVGDLTGEELEPDPFRYGFRGEVGFSYDILENQGILVQGEYEQYRANSKTHFTTGTGEDLGIKEWPVYRIRNIPVSISYLFHKEKGRFDFFAGPGLGYQWTRFIEKWPDYGASLVPESEYTYSGSAAFFKVTGGGVWHFSRHVSLSLPLSYRHAKVKEMKLTSSSGAQPENDYLVDTDGRKIPVDLSGFSIGLGLIIR